MCLINYSLRLTPLIIVHFVLKTVYNTDKTGLDQVDNAEKKIPDTNGLVKKPIIMIRLIRLKVKYLVLLA